MDKVTVGSVADSKEDYVVAVEAAATTTLGVGELAIFVGTNVAASHGGEGLAELNLIKDHLRELGFPTGVNGLNVAVHTVPGTGKVDMVLFDLINMPAATEDNVIIAYQNAFYPEGNSVLFDSAIKRAIEKYREQVLTFV